jgi:hypothetical protein
MISGIFPDLKIDQMTYLWRAGEFGKNHPNMILNALCTEALHVHMRKFIKHKLILFIYFISNASIQLNSFKENKMNIQNCMDLVTVKRARRDLRHVGLNKLILVEEERVVQVQLIDLNCRIQNKARTKRDIKSPGLTSQYLTMKIGNGADRDQQLRQDHQ